MFKCSECGCEYKDKPDFCECGNDIFTEEIEQTVEPIKNHRNNNFFYKDILSWIIFGFLLLISILVLIFFPKIKVENGSTIPKNNTIKKNTDIPNINSFWMDCKPPSIQDQETEKFQNMIKIQVKQNTNDLNQLNKTKTQNIKTNIATSKDKTISSQTKQVSKPNIKQTTIPKTSRPQTQQMPYEVVNYRTALRQRLLSNLDIYMIDGHGTCGIEFEIDENGKLINRGFSFQSDNKTVNDAVYRMLMRTPRFNPPPETIINKKIKLIFDLDNESYSIRYVD